MIVAFVVFGIGVVRWLLSLDEVRFQDQGFEYRVRLLVSDHGHPFEHQPNFWPASREDVLNEVAPHPIPQ